MRPASESERRQPDHGLRVLYFAALRELAGTSGEVVELRGELTVRELIERLEASHGSLVGQLSRVRCAVDGELVAGDHRLEGASEVAFLPPFAGG
ncbi:MAG TPA: MoaD/ThiS family protein [Polyangiaceae bacterium]|nr:MoaD/ThiS family protein [Polyangiaceae bacterium]